MYVVAVVVCQLPLACCRREYVISVRSCPPRSCAYECVYQADKLLFSVSILSFYSVRGWGGRRGRGVTALTVHVHIRVPFTRWYSFKHFCLCCTGFGKFTLYVARPALPCVHEPCPKKRATCTWKIAHNETLTPMLTLP